MTTKTALRPGQSQFTGRQGASVFIFISAYDGKGLRSRDIIIAIFSKIQPLRCRPTFNPPVPAGYLDTARAAWVGESVTLQYDPRSDSVTIGSARIRA